jgi:putative ABC transport system substrate-binding protein
VKDALKEAGYEPGANVELIERNAEGDMATLATIVQQFVDEDVDLIVATTTPAAQAAYKATQGQGGPPVFYNGVSNPYIAELATDAKNHPAWVIGNQLLDPVAKTFELLKEIKPAARVVGIVYNPAEANSAYLLEVAQAEAEKAGLTLETATVANSNEVQTAAESLLGRNLDAFMVLSDNTVSSAFPTMVQLANDNDILLLGTSASYPPQGGAASYGIDPYQEGLDSGALIVKYLKGEVDIAKELVQVQDAVLLTVNPKAAEEQGVTLPEALVSRADEVIE